MILAQIGTLQVAAPGANVIGKTYIKSLSAKIEYEVDCTETSQVPQYENLFWWSREKTLTGLKWQTRKRTIKLTYDINIEASSLVKSNSGIDIFNKTGMKLLKDELGREMFKIPSQFERDLPLKVPNLPITFKPPTPQKKK